MGVTPDLSGRSVGRRGLPTPPPGPRPLRPPPLPCCLKLDNPPDTLVREHWLSQASTGPTTSMSMDATREATESHAPRRERRKERRRTRHHMRATTGDLRERSSSRLSAHLWSPPRLLGRTSSRQESSFRETPEAAVLPQHWGGLPRAGAGGGRDATSGHPTLTSPAKDMASWPLPSRYQGLSPGSKQRRGGRWARLLGEGGRGFVQGGSTVGPVDQLALGGHDEGQGHAGLAGALGARVRHRHGVHASSCGFGRKRLVGPRERPRGAQRGGGGDRAAPGPEKVGVAGSVPPAWPPAPGLFLARQGPPLRAMQRWCSKQEKKQGLSCLNERVTAWLPTVLESRRISTLLVEVGPTKIWSQ